MYVATRMLLLNNHTVLFHGQKFTSQRCTSFYLAGITDIRYQRKRNFEQKYETFETYEKNQCYLDHAPSNEPILLIVSHPKISILSLSSNVSLADILQAPLEATRV